MPGNEGLPSFLCFLFLKCELEDDDESHGEQYEDVDMKEGDVAEVGVPPSEGETAMVYDDLYDDLVYDDLYDDDVDMAPDANLEPEGDQQWEQVGDQQWEGEEDRAEVGHDANPEQELLADDPQWEEDDAYEYDPAFENQELEETEQLDQQWEEEFENRELEATEQLEQELFPDDANLDEEYHYSLLEQELFAEDFEGWKQDVAEVFRERRWNSEDGSAYTFEEFEALYLHQAWTQKELKGWWDECEVVSREEITNYYDAWDAQIKEEHERDRDEKEMNHGATISPEAQEQSDWIGRGTKLHIAEDGVAYTVEQFKTEYRDNWLDKMDAAPKYKWNWITKDEKEVLDPFSEKTCGFELRYDIMDEEYKSLEQFQEEYPDGWWDAWIAAEEIEQAAEQAVQSSSESETSDTSIEPEKRIDPIDNQLHTIEDFEKFYKDQDYIPEFARLPSAITNIVKINPVKDGWMQRWLDAKPLVKVPIRIPDEPPAIEKVPRKEPLRLDVTDGKFKDKHEFKSWSMCWRAIWAMAGAMHTGFPQRRFIPDEDLPDGFWAKYNELNVPDPDWEWDDDDDDGDWGDDDHDYDHEQEEEEKQEGEDAKEQEDEDEDEEENEEGWLELYTQEEIDEYKKERQEWKQWEEEEKKAREAEEEEELQKWMEEQNITFDEAALVERGIDPVEERNSILWEMKEAKLEAKEEERLAFNAKMKQIMWYGSFEDFENKYAPFHQEKWDAAEFYEPKTRGGFYREMDYGLGLAYQQYTIEEFEEFYTNWENRWSNAEIQEQPITELDKKLLRWSDIHLFSRTKEEEKKRVNRINESKTLLQDKKSDLAAHVKLFDEFWWTYYDYKHLHEVLGTISAFEMKMHTDVFFGIQDTIVRLKHEIEVIRLEIAINQTHAEALVDLNERRRKRRRRKKQIDRKVRQFVWITHGCKDGIKADLKNYLAIMEYENRDNPKPSLVTDWDCEGNHGENEVARQIRWYEADLEAIDSDIGRLGAKLEVHKRTASLILIQFYESHFSFRRCGHVISAYDLYLRE